jgi:ferredoxin-type protein NapG
MTAPDAGPDPPPLSRRAMLLGGFLREPARSAGDARSTPSRRAREGAARVHRPPGAVDEPAFLAGCTRCGDCIDACPVDAIVLTPERYGAAAGTPMIDPMNAPCVMCEDMPCIASCEPGVLSPDIPVRMGTASIRSAYCLAYMGTLCTVCSERCPVEGAIAVDAVGKPTVNAETCTGCGVCQHVCPAPYNAVLILPAERGGGDTDAASPAPDDEPGFDWRQAYFGDRSLRPPEPERG